MTHQVEVAEYVEYGSKFSKDYTDNLRTTIFELKKICINFAAMYTCIWVQHGKYAPKIKAVVYCPKSDTYYVHTNNQDFSKYLLPRLKNFFLMPPFDFEAFTITEDIIDDENIMVEIHVKDESSIINNGFFKVPTIYI